MAVICFTFITFWQKFSEAREELATEMEGNIFAGIGEAMIDSIQLKWRWAVIVIGVGCVLACAVVDRMEADR